jgi:hypothetical protein
MSQQCHSATSHSRRRRISLPHLPFISWFKKSSPTPFEDSDTESLTQMNNIADDTGMAMADTQKKSTTATQNIGTHSYK